MALLDLADVKAQLNVTSATQDAAVALYMTAATEVIERHTGERTSPATYTEQVTLPGSTYLSNHPVTAVTAAVDSDGNSIDLADLEFDSLSVSSCSVFGKVTVTYQAGYVTPPENYVLAGMIIVQHLWQSKRGGMPTASPDLDGSGAGIQPRTAFGFAIPRMALELLGAESPLGFA